MSLKTSWRWTFGLVGIIVSLQNELCTFTYPTDITEGAFSIIACFGFLPETYPPRLLELKARGLRKATGNPSLRSKYDNGQTSGRLFRQSITRPMKMLMCCPVVGIVSLLLAIAYSYMYLMFTTFTEVFESAYGFNSGEAGLTYLGLGIGSLIGQYAMDLIMKWRRRQILAQNQAPKPEDYLPPLIAAGFFLSIGLFWYGWSVEYKVRWIVPSLGAGVCGIGITPFFLSVQTYLVEAYTIYSASALAANTAVRCIFGVTVPLAGPHLYERLGLGWGNSVLGFLALIVAPASFWLAKHGEQMRRNFRFSPTL